MTAKTDFTIYQGDSSPIWKVRIDTVLVSQSTCRQVVRVDLSSTPLIDAAVTDTVTEDGVEWFRVTLTPAQTATLTANRIYLWIVEIDAPGVTPPAKREYHGQLRVIEQGAT